MFPNSTRWRGRFLFLRLGGALWADVRWGYLSEISHRRDPRRLAEEHALTGLLAYYDTRRSQQRGHSKREDLGG
jgi:hypothetical protein